MSGKDLYHHLDKLYDKRMELQLEYDCQTFDILRGKQKEYSMELIEYRRIVSEQIEALENARVII